MPDRTGARRRLGSIRLSLIMLALVPSVTLAAMWGVTTTQLFSEGLRLRSQTELSRSTGAMGTETTLALQGERAVSAAWLAKVPGSPAALDEKRAATDAAVAKLVQRSEEIQQAPPRIADQLYSVLGSVGSLEYYRDQVDHPTDITAEQALDQYTSIIDDQIHAFQQLSQVDDGDLTSQAGPLVAIEHAAELTSQEDVALTLAWPSGHLDEKAWEHFVQLVNTRRWLVEDQIVPALSGDAKTQTERILGSADWRTLTAVEDQVLAARPVAGTGRVALPDAGERWTAAMAKVSVRYTDLIRQQTSGLLTRSADKAHEQLLTAAWLSAAGLIALLICLVMSWRITRSLSRRLRGLREATLGLAQERLPDVVARLDRGEKVDADRAAPELDYGSDELGQVAQAFNAAQRTAVTTAVELADTRRGFQKVILGIARQSQNLVNLQLSRLDTLEREHQDPDVLAGLYELDSTASQLRRYEENLVIISGGQPRRSWTEPVALIDILRSAVGEVAEYQRVEVRTEEEVCLAPPAVADVIHLLAELIENATLYSPAPSPVGVRAGLVAKGLAVEVEDRGLGMSEDEYAAFNAHLAEAPKFDVVALADDLRLGMFVIARLANRHGIQVTLRSSPYGGTTAIVLIPHEIVVREEQDEPENRGGVPAARPTGVTAGTSPATERTTDPTDPTAPASTPAQTADASSSADTRDSTVTPDPAHTTDSATDAEGSADTPRPASTPRTADSPTSTVTPDSADAPNPTGAPDTAATPGPAGAPDPADAPNPTSTPRSADAPNPTSTPRSAASPHPATTPHSAGSPTSTPTPPPGRRKDNAPLSAARAGLTPLPRRVPQTSLAVELREDVSAAREEEDADEFTPDHAASSLAGFQRGTLRARDEDGLLDTPQDPAAGPAPDAVPKEATAHGTDPLDTPEEVSTVDTNGPPGAPGTPAPAGTHAPQDPPVAARTPHTDRS
ncbi:signal transduction histidine kinase [Streptomyces sp. SAI-135]|uniref:sensor histidine kinase n=1 Tax=unclassified Streptomyces TaxID=2593676 RepID=UPI002473B99E|nr:MULTISPECIES: nitrate- and nitrite sensing domain-containing protein [unclassified Streptomyces]MDH6515774.1 signal transduction histidine kinase [Streptomyces sp. SAI-090]MDH6620141.1 signal transduction histidine kinase [Streptomyces sp. SAI-135]